MEKIGLILLSGILIDNFVLSRFLGICPFLGVSNKLHSAIGMGSAVTVVMFISTAVTWPIYTYLLYANGFEYFTLLLSIFIIAGLVQLLEIFLKRHMPSLFRSFGVYLPLITTNCAVLGVVLLNFQDNYTFIEALANAIGAGLGFMLAIVLFSGIRERLQQSITSKYFEGAPITLIAASIVSLAFMGFKGIV